MQDTVKKAQQHQSPADVILAVQRSQFRCQLYEKIALLIQDPRRSLIPERRCLPGVSVTFTAGVLGRDWLAMQHRCRVEIRRKHDGTQPREKHHHVVAHSHRIVTFSAN